MGGAALALSKSIQRMLEHIVDERAGRERIKLRHAARLGLQTILHKECKPAGIERIHTRSGQIEAFSVQSVNRVRTAQRSSAAPLRLRVFDSLVILIVVIGSPHGGCPVARKIRARKFDRRSFRLQAVTHGLRPVGGKRHIRQQLPHCVHEVGRPRFTAACVDGVIRQQQLVRRARECSIECFLLHQQAFLAVGFEFHAERIHFVAVHVTQQRGRGRVFRYQAVVDAQQDDIFRIFCTRTLDVAAGHAVERNRNRTHIILAEHQPEQLRETVERQRHITAHPCKLLHRRDQDFPQLAVLVGQLQTARLLVSGGAVGHTLRRVHREKECIERTHAVTCRLLTCKCLAQCGERRDCPFAECVQLGKLCLRVLVDGQTVAVRMLGPLAFPCSAADVPGEHIVL